MLQHFAQSCAALQHLQTQTYLFFVIGSGRLDYNLQNRAFAHLIYFRKTAEERQESIHIQFVVGPDRQNESFLQMNSGADIHARIIENIVIFRRLNLSIAPKRLDLPYERFAVRTVDSGVKMNLLTNIRNRYFKNERFPKTEERRKKLFGRGNFGLQFFSLLAPPGQTNQIKFEFQRFEVRPAMFPPA